MWAIKNLTPYKAESTWGRDKEGVHEWIVAVKCTYDIKPDGKVKLADEQLDPLLIPEYNGEDGVSSLKYDADLVAPKPTTDIILNGTAHAPNSRPSQNFLVSMCVGSVKKVIRVLGNSRWEAGVSGLSPSSIEPVLSLPITYERAYGGYDHIDSDPKRHKMDSRNPVGCGVFVDSHNKEGQSLPNFEYPQGKLEKMGPAGFGAIDSFWSPRRELSGTYDESWQKSRSPLLPGDWSARTLLCSPIDQLPASHLNGGEAVELVNLTQNRVLRFSLPKARFTYTTHFGSLREEHRSKLSTVIIEPDYPRVILVWLTALAVRTDVDYLDETVIREKRYI